MFKWTLILPFVFTSLLVGCDSSNNQDPSVGVNVDNQLLLETEQRLLDFEQVFSLGQVFRDHPQADKRLIRSALDKSRAGVQILVRYQGSLMPSSQAQLAYNELSSAIYLLEKVRLLEGDTEETSDLFNNIRLLRHDLGNSLGKSANSWVLYKHNFGDGIEPEFRAPEGEDRHGSVQWGTNFQIDLPKAKVQASEGYAWLVSRSFDLSQVQNPAFRFHATYLVSSRDSELTLYEVVKRVFKVYAILDLKPGESLEKIPEERKIRIEYNPDEVPKARDFHDRWLPFRSLSAYKDHKISIGFLFDTRDIPHPQFYIWDIYDFEIVGAGKIQSAPYLYEANFSSGISPFNSMSSLFLGKSFVADNGAAFVETTETERTDAALLSPMYYARKIPYFDHKLLLTFKNDLILSGPEAKAEVLISTDYIPGRQFKRQGQGWTPLSVNSAEDTDGSQVDLTDYIGQEFYLAFYFSSKQAGDFWRLTDLMIQGHGTPLYDIPFVVEENVEIDLNHQFDFTSEEFQQTLITELEEDDGPLWRPSRDSDGMRCNAHRGSDPARPGWSRMIVPSVKLAEGKNLLRILHRVKFFKSSPFEHLKVAVRASGSEDEWQTLNFTPNNLLGDTGSGNEFEYSSWALLPFENQEVDVAFIYEASETGSPEWIVQALEIGLGVKE